MAERDGSGVGSARRRRERRLRSWWRHERMTVAAELAVALHHSRGVGPACTARSPTGTDACELSGKAAVVVDQVQRHYMEDLGTVCPFVQILDLPVPQTVDSVTDALRMLDRAMAEQVIEVPMVSCSPCPSRCPIPVPQSAEQLVEVPTVLTPTRIAVQIAEQIIGTPVLHVRGQGSLPGQGSPASGKRISERIVEQIVGFPEQTVEQIVDTSLGDGCGQGASSSAGLADEDFTGFFRTFLHGKKVRSAGQVSADLPRHVSSWTPAAYGQPSGSIEQEKEKEKELNAEEEEDEDPTGWNLSGTVARVVRPGRFQNLPY